MEGLPFVSIIIPCREERRFIEACLSSVVSNGFPHERMEVLIADGMSEDGTRELILQHARAHPFIRLLDNPERITPVGLNRALRQATGDVIIRLDTHATYEPGYIGRCVDVLGASGADNVGGVSLTCPASDSARAGAIALALSHPLGVGNSRFRIGAGAPCWVDTVPFGCWPRRVFEQVGLFDEELVRNQDDEHNARLLARGMRILLDPAIVSRYYARDTLGKLAGMAFQYALYKPLAAWKVGRVYTWRQLAPAAFTGALAAGLVLAPLLPIAAWALAAVAGSYVVALLLASGGELVRRRSLAVAAWLPLVFAVLHLSYGLGYWAGLVKLLARLRRPRVGSVPRLADAPPGGQRERA